VIRLSTRRRPRHIFQLHLSRDCNSPHLAAGTAEDALARLGHHARIHTTCQGVAGPTLTLGLDSLADGAFPPGSESQAVPVTPFSAAYAFKPVAKLQPLLPGFE
jgi:hypothetical protein